MNITLEKYHLIQFYNINKIMYSSQLLSERKNMTHFYQFLLENYKKKNIIISSQ